MNDTVVILPTYNEADNLRVLLPQIQQYKVDILVVDDSPNPETALVARGFNVEVLSRKGKTGRISALLDGIAATKHPNIITMDSDLQHPAAAVPGIIAALTHNDIVVASRRVENGGYAHFPYMRRLISSAANLIAFPLVPKLHDRTSGFVAFRRKVINGKELPQGFSTLTLSVFVLGEYSTFTEVPYTFQERQNGNSKLSLAIVFDHLGQLGRLYLYKIKGR